MASGGPSQATKGPPRVSVKTDLGAYVRAIWYFQAKNISPCPILLLNLPLRRAFLVNQTSGLINKWLLFAPDGAQCSPRHLHHRDTRSQGLSCKCRPFYIAGLSNPSVNMRRTTIAFSISPDIA